MGEAPQYRAKQHGDSARKRLLRIRINDAEYDAIRSAADARGLSMSAWLMRIAMDEAEEVLAIRAWREAMAKA